MAGISLGCAAVDISPALGSRFVGHLNRNRPAEAILDPLFLNALKLRAEDGGELLYLDFDLLEFGPAEAERLSLAAAREAGLERGKVFLSTTHTHTGPAVIELAGRPADPAYLARLERRVIEAAGEAGRSLRPVSVRAGRGLARLGVNRRLRQAGRIVMAPNPDGPSDPELQVVLFEVETGRPAAIMVNYAVHPTTLGVGLFAVSADYPGRMRAALKRRFGPDCAVIFIQGACGDVKPAVYDRAGAFEEGGEADIERIGGELAAAVERVMRGAAPVEAGSIRAARSTFAFRYARTPTAGELEAELGRAEREIAGLEASVSPGGHIDPLAAARVMRDWSERMLASARRGGLPAAVEAELRFFSLGGRVAFAGIPGELFCELGRAVKDASPFAHTLIGGYCGGSLGYIPTAAALAEGGYEASDAFKFYGYPAAFAADTGERLVSACAESLKQLFL